MKHIGLFEGIGGFSLAAHWMGWETIAWCEWNEFGQKVLKHHFPKATPHGDITKTDFTIYRGQCDILTGGFPCQPYSVAGQRKGKEDERHLWPEMLRAIQEIEPTYIVGENVRGLLNWNGGLVFDEVCTDLENLGYQIAPCLIPAVGVNAPHKRERIWFVAYSERFRYGGRTEKSGNDNAESNGRMDTESGRNGDEIRGEGERCGTDTGNADAEFGNASNERNVTNTDNNGYTPQGTGSQTERSWSGDNGKSEKWNEQTERTDGLPRLPWNATDTISIRHSRRTETSRNDNSERIGRLDTDCGRNGNEVRGKVDGCGGVVTDTNTSRLHEQYIPSEPNESSTRCRTSYERGDFSRFPTQSPVCFRDDEFSLRLDGITFSKLRNESIKAAGNAIVPQIAYQIFKAIEQLDKKLNQ